MKVSSCSASVAPPNTTMIANESQCTADTWVNFKVWGGIGLVLVFAVAQGLWLARHMQDPREEAPGP